MHNTPALASAAGDTSLQQFMDHSEDVFWLADLRSGHLLYVSPRVTQWWGISVDALMRNPALWNESVDPLDAHLLPQPFFADQAETECAVREYRILDPQGQVRWIRDRRFYLYDQGGQLTRLGGIAEDVSESKQREDRQDDFLAVVTHELRSPLNAMRGWTHVLRRAGALNPLQVKALEAIDRSNQAQARLMDEFQDQQRILQGHVKLQYTRTNLSALLDESVTAVQEQAQAKGIRIEVRQERSLGLISADAHRLRQALTVLLANAIKLNPENGSISVSTRQGSGGLFIEVRDSGDSLPLTEMPSARLGLHLARQVVALHGGQLTVRHEGQQAGTTFIIELPDKLRLTNPAPLPDLATNG